VKIWVDAQLSPLIAQWLSSTYGVEAVAVRDLRLRDARDRDIFLSARGPKAIILTKDSDMADLVTHSDHRLRSCGSRAGTHPMTN
jgi:predicted nuclease of predicted toxin-antitoxin system